MISLIRKCTPWLLPAVLVLFILEVVCLPFVVKYTWPTDKPSPTHTLTYKKNELFWDTATLIDPSTGAAKLDLFSAVYEEGDPANVTAESDNGDKIIAPGLKKDSVIRLYNSRISSISYWAALYYKKSTEDIPIIPDMDAENIFSEITTSFTLPNEITAQGYELLRAYHGYVDGQQMSDLTVKWEWPFEDPADVAGRDAIDTELGNRAANGDFENIEVGVYIYIEDYATGGGGGGGGGSIGGGGDKPDTPDTPVDPPIDPDTPVTPPQYDDDDVIITHPDGTITYPDDGVVGDDGTVTFPDGTVIAPDGTITHPDGTVTPPDGGTNAGSGTVIYPDGTIVHKPATNPNPNGTITHPDGTITFPNGTGLHPSGVLTYPDGTILYPDGMIKHPDGTLSKPTGSTTTKQGTVLYPDGSMLHPWNSPIYPNAEIQHPNGALSKPQGGLIYGGGVMIYPDGTILYPDGIIKHPDGTYVYPTNLVYNEDGSVLYPDGTIVYPQGKTGGKPTIVKPTGGTPDTGDTSNMALYGTLIIMTLIILILLFIEKKMEARRSKK